jgi:deoxyribonuclease-4
MIEFGAHVDNADPIAEAQARGAGLSQFFLGDPQGWKAPTVAYAAGADALRTDAEAAGIGLFVHGPYIVNVASTNNRVRIPSRKILQQQIDLAAQIGARGLIIHGGHVGAGDDLAVGFDNWRKAIDGTDLKLPVLIENTAGGAGAVARTLENIDGLVDKVRAITGRIDLVHANDSRDEFGSNADRHADLGTGFVDPDGLCAVIVEADAPVIFETPGAKAGSSADIAWLAARLSR